MCSPWRGGRWRAGDRGAGGAAAANRAGEGVGFLLSAASASCLPRVPHRRVGVWTGARRHPCAVARRGPRVPEPGRDPTCRTAHCVDGPISTGSLIPDAGPFSTTWWSAWLPIYAALALDHRASTHWGRRRAAQEAARSVRIDAPERGLLSVRARASRPLEVRPRGARSSCARSGGGGGDRRPDVCAGCLPATPFGLARAPRPAMPAPASRTRRLGAHVPACGTGQTRIGHRLREMGCGPARGRYPGSLASTSPMPRR